MFGADGARAIFGAADGPEENGMGGFGGREGFLGEGLPVGIYRALYCENG